MSEISVFFSWLVSWVWGLPLVILLLGGGLYLFFQSGFLPFRGMGHAFMLLIGRYDEDDLFAEGQISHFKALSNALAATIGLGNIAGVSVAIYQGGPGAIFWMWIAAIIGMNTKFYECTLAMIYRGRDSQGEVQGGAMYVILKAFPKPFHFLAYLFSFFGLIGCLALFQMNQISVFLQSQFSVDPLILGISTALVVAYVLKGGIKRIASVTSSLVPLMCLLYVSCCIVILVMNAEQIPSLFLLIFKEAFSGSSVVGGVVGLGVKEIFQIGVKRAAFSNEAGIGTAPMAHGNAKTKEPVREGLVAMLGPLIDTLIVCTMTALVVLIYLPELKIDEMSGILMTLKVFELSFPVFGVWLLGGAVCLFGFTTIIGMANYNQKCWDFIFRDKFIFGHNMFVFVFCSTLVFASISAPIDVVNIIDCGIGLMVIPNMIATLFLAHKVKKASIDYFQRLPELKR